MRAVVFDRYGGPEELELRECDVPEPTEGEVRVKVRAVSVNDWDHSALRGEPWINRLFFGLHRPWRRILGSDVSGVVEAVGRGVRQWRAGDEVFADLSGRWGGLAEYVCAPERLLTRKPAFMTHVEAAALPQAGLLALQGLELGGCRASAKLLINGAGGGVGTFAVQLARHLGARITGVDRAEKAEPVRSLGAERVLDYRITDFAEASDKYDVILDTRSTRSPFACARALAPGGRYVTVGGDLPRLLALFTLGPLAGRDGRQVRILALRPNQGLQRLVDLCAQGQLSAVIDSRYRLEDSALAFQRFASGGHVGKLVIEVD